MATDVNQRALLPVRLTTALLQALALYWLYEASVKPETWPASQPSIYRPMLLVAISIPPLVLLGVSRLRTIPLALWTLAAATAVAVIGYHDATRDAVRPWLARPWSDDGLRVGGGVAIMLFVAQALVVDSVTEGRWRPSYAGHFDTAWKQGIQLALAIVFTAVFWGVLGLGAGLFKLLNIDFLARLISHAWFAYPATTLAISMAIHATDVQPALIRGTRSIVLTLFSWLMPLLTLLILGFLAFLPFISLAPLWNTHFATSLLLTAGFAQVFFINTCYQDGAAAMTRMRVKQIAASAAALELAPIMILAACALWLRVAEYGWTGQRVVAASGIILAGCYATGYLIAAFSRSAWLKPIETTNWITAYATVALILALLTPVADPARLMVESQIGRLRSHAVTADKFDFVALKFAGARWGTAALEELRRQTDGPDAAEISRRATAALNANSAYQPQFARKSLSHEEILARIDIYPPNHPFPTELLDDMEPLGTPSTGCFSPNFPQHCIARFVTLGPNQPEAIMFLDIYVGRLLQQDAQGHWGNTATITGNIFCDTIRKAMLGDAVVVRPHDLPDLMVDGQRIVLAPPTGPCPRPNSSK